MVKDKEAKALNFIVNMKFNDSCICFGLEMKHCNCLMQFLGDSITPSDGKEYFMKMADYLWNDFMKEEDDFDVMKDKVISFLKPHASMKNAIELFFHFDIKNQQTSVFEELKICLPTTCHLLGIPRCLGQAVKASLLRKEEAATRVLETMGQKQYSGRNFYRYFANNILVPVKQTNLKARGIVKALNGHIIPLLEQSL